MRSYHCFYLMKGEEPSELTPFVSIKATDAVSAAQQAMRSTGCARVVDVVRIEG